MYHAVRFHSLDRPQQRRLIEEEDQILSVVLINVTLFMAATGVPPEDIQEMLYRYIAKTRVCDSEGTLLNSLIQELMECVSVLCVEDVVVWRVGGVSMLCERGRGRE